MLKRRFDKLVLCGYDLSDDADSMRHALHLPRTANGMPSISVYLEDSEGLLDRANATAMYGHLVGYGPAVKSDDSLFMNRSTRGQRVSYIYEQKYDDRKLSQDAAWYRIPEMSKFSSIYCANAMVLREKIYDLTAFDKSAAYESEHRRRMMSVLIMGQPKDAVLIDNNELI